jgi:hypothetical protein
MTFKFQPSTSACLFEVSVLFGKKTQLIKVFDWVAYSDLQKDQQELLPPGDYSNLKFYTPPALRTSGNFTCISKIQGPIITAFIQWIHNNRKSICLMTTAEREAIQLNQVANELRRVVEIQGGGDLVDATAYTGIVKAFQSLTPDEAEEIALATCTEWELQQRWKREGTCQPTGQGADLRDKPQTSKRDSKSSNED